MNQNIGTKTENNISTGGHFGITDVIRVSSVTLRLGRDTNFLPNNHSTCNMWRQRGATKQCTLLQTLLTSYLQSGMFVNIVVN